MHKNKNHQISRIIFYLLLHDQSQLNIGKH